MKKIFLITILTNFIYCQDLQLTLESITRDIPTANFEDKPGGVHHGRIVLLLILLQQCIQTC